MRKWHWNFIIDALLLLCMAAMTGKGLLLRYVLIPGRDRFPVYGRNVDLEMFGWDRHEWGTVHLYVGYALAALVVLHIILHWNMIPGMFRRLISGKALRWTTGVAFAAVCVLLVVFPFIVEPTVLERGGGRGFGPGRGGGRQQSESPALAPIADETQAPRGGREGSGGGGRGAAGIKGRMTLGEVSKAYGVPVDYLTSGLGIRETLSEQDRLGWLRQRYDFTMRDVEAVIENYRKSK